MSAIPPTKQLTDFLPEEHDTPENEYPLSEQIILVALHFSNDLLDKVRPLVPDPAMFSSYPFGEAYRAMCQMRDEGIAFDVTSVAVRMKKPFAYVLPILDDLHQDLWWIRDADHEKVLTHARIVADAYVRRQVGEAARKGEDSAALLERIGALQRRGVDRLFDAGELTLLAYTEAHTHHERLPYPFADTQRASAGGVRPDELVIVAGRPGTGKTAWLLQFAWSLAAQGKRVLFATAEMSAQSLMQRLCSHIAKQNLFTLVTDEQREAHNEALERFGQTAFSILELTEVEQLEAHLRANQRYDVVFIDYLQQLHTRASGKGEYELITAITRQLDAMSMKFHLPFIVASQFSRAAEGQQPGMATLRGSGAIEQAADVIISLWSKPEEQTDPTRAKVYLDILKNRNGYTVINGAREYALWFDKPVFTFRDIDQRRTG